MKALAKFYVLRSAVEELKLLIKLIKVGEQKY